MRATRSILPLQAEGVGFEIRGKTLLQDVDCELRPGLRTLIMGPNGAGKSLTLRLCHGLLKPSAGRIVWAGAASDTGTGSRHQMVFQRPVMLRRSALANVVYALSVAGVPSSERHARAMEALERCGLVDLAARPARVLSGGEQQRLALARARALKPEVLFLDEPTSALDPAATRAIEQMIETFHEEGVKIVMTTHDLGQARRLADEVLFLHRGRLLEQTPATEFFDQPRSGEARAFLKGELVW